MILGSGKDFVGKICRLGIVPILWIFALLILASSVQADVERIVEYEYDGAGNIVRIISQEQSTLLVVSPLDPQFINLGRTITVTATGSSLLGVDITTDVSGLTINAVSSTSSDLTFELTASNQVTLGNVIIKFATGFGEVEQTILVAETPPALSTEPSPIAIEDNNVVTNVTLKFSEPRPEDETYTINTTDTGIADVSTTSFTILAGQTEVQVSLTGVSSGVTDLEVLLASKFYTYTFAVYVGKTYLQLAEELRIDGDESMLTRNLFANRVGILKDSRSGAQSFPVGVIVGSSDVLLSPSVGVLFDDFSGFAYSGNVGVALGAIPENVSPLTTNQDTTVNFEITGINLDEITGVSISPSVDLTIGTFTVNAEGTLLTVPVTTGLTAALGSYEITLQDAQGDVETRSGALLLFDVE